MKLTIYDIDKAILACVDEFGEIIDIEALEALNIARDKKIEDILCWHKQELAISEAIKAERDALYAREKQHANRAESLKNYAAAILAGQSFEAPRAKAGWRKSTETVISNIDLLPKKFKKVTITYSPDKAAIKEAILSGKKVNCAELIEKQNIQIK